MARKSLFRGRRALPVTLLSAVGIVVLAAVPVQVTGSGIDLYALLCAGVLLLVVERTAGDWVADLLGPAGTALAFAIIAAAGVAYLLSDNGRKRGERFLAVAEAHGYRPAYFTSEEHLRRDGKEKLTEEAPGVPDAPDPATSSPDVSASSSPSPASSAPPASGTTPQPVNSGLSAFLFSGRSREQATARLIPTPGLLQLGGDVVLRFSIIGQPKKTPRDVSFFVNGVFVAHQPIRSDGTAEARWRPRLPGQYQLRAETGDSSLETRTFAATVQVLPHRR